MNLIGEYRSETKRDSWHKTAGALYMGLAIVFAFQVLFCGRVYAQVYGEYTLGSGDTISITVYDEPELTLDAQLSDAGTLDYPFLGKLKVTGLTVTELQNLITIGLKGDYLIAPKVAIGILQYRQFFINGEVVRSGGFSFQPGLTVRKAVSLAQGFTERADKKDIYVISDSDPAQKPRKVTLNSPVKPGDIITVEQSFF